MAKSGAPLERGQHVIQLAIAIATALGVVVALVVGLRKDGPGDSATTTLAAPLTSAASTPTTATTTAAAAAATTTAVAATSTAPLSGVLLGSDLPALRTEPCRSSSSSTGAAWRANAARIGTQNFGFVYFCDIVRGASGSAEFDLGGTYRRLRTTIGFASDSQTTTHRVQFSFVADGREFVGEPVTLSFGESRTLDLDVSGVSRLTLKVTEQSLTGGNDATSHAGFAEPRLVR